MNKKIGNIVFYKFKGEDNTKVQACIFYNDGTVENVSYDEALKASRMVAKEENATGKEAFDSLLNKRRIFVMSGEELTRRFDDFIVNENIKNAIDNALDNINYVDSDDKVSLDDKKKVFKAKFIPIAVNNMKNKNDLINNFDDKKNEIITDNEEEESFDSKETQKIAPIASTDNILKDNYTYTDNNMLNDDLDEDLLDDDLDEDINMSDDIDNTRLFNENIGATARMKPIIENKPKEKKEGFFAKIKRIAHGKIVPIAIAASLISGTGLAYALNKVPKEGIMNKANITMEQEASTNGNDDIVVKGYADNNYYDNYTFKELLDVTTHQKQKEVMQNMSNALDFFNKTFADAYLEQGKDIRAALTWDEMIALQMAYNDYSKEEIHAIFNGAEISANDMENAYKNATLQLMGAYVIEKDPNLVDLSQFIHNEEGLKFAQKYQMMLEKAKNTTGTEQIEAVKAFYAELYKDFPITEEVRTEGISHSDKRTIESYKLSVAPMVAAAEIMFQNLEIDATLTDQAIAYFNDLGLCNLAEDKFNKIETITLAGCQSDIENPLYEQFKEAKIKELTEKGIYVIDDEHRDLSKLDRFQELVNGHFRMMDGRFCLQTWFTTETYTITDSWTETHTKVWNKKEVIKTSDRDKAVKEAGEKAVRDAERKVDKQIEKENKKAKEQAEKEAAKKKKEMQKEADKKKKELEKEVKEDEKDLQKDIEDANKKIDNGETVNEKDFDDHNVKFDDEYKDENNNLDDSVKDITTDDTGADKDLPDPNETGKAFDDASKDIEVKVDYDVEEDPTIDKTEDVTTEDTTNNNNENNNDNKETETNNNDNDNNNNNNNNDNDSSEDLPDPNANDNNDNNNNNNNDSEDYDIEYDEEIDRSEDEKKQEVKEEKVETKQEVKEEKHEEKAEPKQEVKEEKHEEKAEPKHEEAPKAEPKQESAPEPKHEEAPKAEPKHESAPEPKHEEAPKAEPKHEEPKKSNEDIVNDYVEKQSKQSDDNDDEKTLVKE